VRSRAGLGVLGKTISFPHGDSSPVTSSPLQLYPGKPWSNFHCYGQSNSYTITGLDRPLGFQESKAPIISRQSEQQDGKIVRPTYRPPFAPQKISPLTHFCQRLSRTQGHSAAKRFKLTKNPIDPIRNRPKPTAPPRTHFPGKESEICQSQQFFGASCHTYMWSAHVSPQLCSCTRVRYGSSTAQMCWQYRVFYLTTIFLCFRRFSAASLPLLWTFGWVSDVNAIKEAVTDSCQIK
jgi:hypothetical protein